MNTAAIPSTVESARLASAVSWGAILAGAAGAAALSLILLILGTGLGASSVSPWSGEGVTATTFGVSTILWLTFTQLAASGMGGYLAGRLRTRWAALHTDEVYFRDTAHGFLAWAVATLVTAALLTSAVTSIVSGGAQVASGIAGGVAKTAAAAAPAVAERSDSSSGASYFVDSLFRTEMAGQTANAAAGSASTGATPSGSAQTTAEVGRIMANGLSTGTLAADDARYAGQLVAQRTGLSQADAENRVTDTFAKMQTKAKDAETAARDAADKARKASAYASLWLFVSLLAGAFVASLSATYGGRRRDLF
ncbi:hypothetical protein BH09PSE5_BH09PSE5_15580 [soil metagenome]